MKHIKLFENYIKENLNIGVNTNVGIIDDMTDTQYYVNGTWYHKSIVKPSENKREPLKNRGTIDPNMIIETFQNGIDSEKLEKYTDIMRDELLSHKFPPIKGYPIIITESNIGEKYLNGNKVKRKDLGKYAWKITDGHHRVLSALANNLEYVETEIDYSYVNDEDL